MANILHNFKKALWCPSSSSSLLSVLHILVLKNAISVALLNLKGIISMNAMHVIPLTETQLH